MSIKEKKFSDIIISLLKTAGILIWAVLPMTFITTAEMYQNTTPTFLKWTISIGIILFTLISILFFFNYYKKIGDLKLKTIQLKDFRISIGLFVLLKIVTIIGTSLNEYFYGNQMTSNDASLQISESLITFPLYLIIFNLIISLGAPILEELAFRGIFTNIWFEKQRKLLPAILTSFLFSLAHGYDNNITFLMYFISGMIYFYAYCRRWNIKDSILLHILNNGFIVVLNFFI